ncbi:hypothetical protein Tco_1224926 [Tanacetum coccineum]
MKRVKSTLTELYKHYKLKSDKEKDQNTPVASSSTPHTCVASRLKVDIESGFGKYMEKREGIKNTEVDIYLRDGTERRDDKFDVLGWLGWRITGEVRKLPILSLQISTAMEELICFPLNVINNLIECHISSRPSQPRAKLPSQELVVGVSLVLVCKVASKAVKIAIPPVIVFVFARSRS